MSDKSDPLEVNGNPMTLSELDASLHHIHQDKIKEFVDTVMEWEGERVSPGPSMMGAAYAAYTSKHGPTMSHSGTYEFSLDFLRQIFM